MDYCGPRGIPLEEFLTWSQDSQQAALMWQAHEASRHGDCGTFRTDWVTGQPDPQHWHEEICPGCARLEQAQAALAANETPTGGLRLVAVSGPADECRLCKANAPRHTH